jgi:4'-phosphopantetheinyl transferase
MNTEKLQWCRAIPGELIYSNDVHVWRASLDLTTVQSESLLVILSPDELARAGRLRFVKDQKKFVAARGILRMILGHYLGKKPIELRFEYSSYGKPILATNAGYDSLHFNLSHSDVIALYAISRGRNIGIDIERVQDNIEVEQVAGRFFSLGEISSLDSVDKKNRSGTFFQYWTRKEAFIKAKGEGISFPMENCDVSLMSAKNLSPIILLGENRENSSWYGQDLFPGHGYAAAIAVEGGDCDLSCWHYSL